MSFHQQNLIAAIVFAFVATASWHPCAAGQQESGFDTRSSQAGATVSGSNPLRPTSLPDLRTGRIAPNWGIEPEVGLAEQRPAVPGPAVPATNLLRQLPSPRVAERPAADLERSFFEQGQPPVVVVWLNSDLQNSLVSERQLKQWMHAEAGEDDLNRATRINTWHVDSGSRVHAAGFISPAMEGTIAFTRSEQQINALAERLDAIRFRFETKKKQLADESGDDDGSKGELNNLLNLAGDWIGRAGSDLKKLETGTEKEDEFEAKLKEQKQQLAAEKKEAASTKPPEKPDLLPSDLGEAIDKLQTELKEKESALQASTESRSEIRERISTRNRRITELPGVLRKNAKEENETKKSIEELNGKAEGDLRRSLQKLVLDAKLMSLEITEESLELESRRQEQVGRILPLQLEELTLEIKRMNAELVILSERSDALRDQEIEERLLAARKALNEKLTQSTPMLKELAEFNQDLAIQQTSLAVKSDELERELINVRQLQEELDVSHERIKEQIKTLGPTASGIRLVEHRRSLISTGKSQNRLLELAERLQSKQTRKLLLKERKDQLVLGDSFKLDVLASVEQQVSGQVQRQIAVDVAEQLLETQKKYAAALEGVLNDIVEKLSALESAHKTLIDKVQEVRAFSDKNALWVRSAKPIELNDLTLCQSGFQSVMVSDQWLNLTKQANANFRKHPYHAGLLALVIGTLLVVRRRLRWSHE